ncbi:MAG: GNAT family N-acetyltransferase [Acidimicrobiales bacterium]
MSPPVRTAPGGLVVAVVRQTVYSALMAVKTERLNLRLTPAQRPRWTLPIGECSWSTTLLGPSFRHWCPLRQGCRQKWPSFCPARRCSRGPSSVSYAGPQLLSSEHVLTGFDCGKPALNDWLVRRSLSNQSGGTSRTWVVIEVETQRVVGFYASSTASVLRSSAPKKFGRNQPEELPAILLGRIGVDAKHKGRGLGAALLRHFMFKAIEVAGSVGVRLVLVHAKDEEARSFYRHYGFVESPVDPMTMMMLIGDV